MLQNNDVITLGLKIYEDRILRCHGRFNNAGIPEETAVSSEEMIWRLNNFSWHSDNLYLEQLNQKIPN